MKKNFIFSSKLQKTNETKVKRAFKLLWKDLGRDEQESDMNECFYAV